MSVSCGLCAASAHAASGTGAVSRRWVWMAVIVLLVFAGLRRHGATKAGQR